MIFKSKILGMEQILPITLLGQNKFYQSHKSYCVVSKERDQAHEEEDGRS